VEALRAVPPATIADPHDAAIASGVVFGRTERVTPSDEAAFLESGLWHLLTRRQMDRMHPSMRTGFQPSLGAAAGIVAERRLARRRSSGLRREVIVIPA
jgi:hypothetical protein